jgi:hypothetical protein
MINSNITYDSKINRYLQRIDRIIGPKKKNSLSPVASTIHKSPNAHKTNNLDNFLKYELTVKILSKVIEKNNNVLMHYFFNICRKQEYSLK